MIRLAPSVRLCILTITLNRLVDQLRIYTTQDSVADYRALEGFLSNRNFCVRLGSCLSDLHEQEMGVPQGSILSITLFGLKINSIVKAISPGVDFSL